MPRYIDIPIFGGGLVTNADLEDIPKDAASSSLNVDIDVPGKIKKENQDNKPMLYLDHNLADLLIG